MSEFWSGVLAGSFGMFAWMLIAAFAFGACKVAGRADDEAETEIARLRLVEPVDPERVL